MIRRWNIVLLLSSWFSVCKSGSHGSSTHNNAGIPFGKFFYRQGYALPSSPLALAARCYTTPVVLSQFYTLCHVGSYLALLQVGWSLLPYMSAYHSMAFMAIGSFRVWPHNPPFGYHAAAPVSGPGPAQHMGRFSCGLFTGKAPSYGSPTVPASFSFELARCRHQESSMLAITPLLLFSTVLLFYTLNSRWFVCEHSD